MSYGRGGDSERPGPSQTEPGAEAVMGTRTPSRKKLPVRGKKVLKKKCKHFRGKISMHIGAHLLAGAGNDTGLGARAS